MWFGTTMGLSRYDGRTMTAYAYGPEIPESQYPQNAWQIVEDISGNMWVGAYGRLHLYQPERDAFQAFVADTNVFAPRQAGLCADSRGNLWVGSATRGLLRFDNEHRQFLSFAIEFKQELQPKAVSKILEDSFGNLWFSYPNGLWRFAWKDSSLAYYPLQEDHERTFDDGIIQALYEDRRKDLWVGTNNGLLHYDRERDRMVPYPLDFGTTGSGPEIQNICEASDGSLWMGVPEGLYVFNPPDYLLLHANPPILSPEVFERYTRNLLHTLEPKQTHRLRRKTNV